MSEISIAQRHKANFLWKDERLPRFSLARQIKDVLPFYGSSSVISLCMPNTREKRDDTPSDRRRRRDHLDARDSDFRRLVRTLVFCHSWRRLKTRGVSFSTRSGGCYTIRGVPRAYDLWRRYDGNENRREQRRSTRRGPSCFVRPDVASVPCATRNFFHKIRTAEK